MVLSSQSPRAAGGRGYASSRGRMGRWKIALVVLVAAAVGYWLLFKDDAPAEVAGSEGADSAEVVADGADGGTGDPGASSTPVSSGAASRDGSSKPNADTAQRKPPVIEPQPAPPPRVAASPSEQSPANPTPDTAANPEPDTARRPPTVVATPGETGRLLREGLAMLGGNQPITGRAQLSALLLGSVDQLTPADADLIRRKLTDLNAQLVFSPQAVPNDPATSIYKVQSGDLLGSIGRRAGVPYPLLEMINGVDANRIRVGQPLKLLNGPVHARVLKSQFVMDVFLEGADGAPVFLASFPVGLGANDNTPAGDWVVANGKVTNPDWRNPNTNEYFPANDPDNPIGEYWVPITGTDETTRARTGFGIHGTVDPSSIGQSESMGCVRLADADIALVYNMLQPGKSTVKIMP